MENNEENEVKNKETRKRLVIVVGIFIVLIICAIIGQGIVKVKEKQEEERQYEIRVEERRKNEERAKKEIESNTCKENLTYPDPTDFDTAGNAAGKPIIYLYPQEETELTVKLGYPEKITCSYPKYENEWDVTANPDGTIIDKESGKKLYSLYWEGEGTPDYNFDEGFCVKGEDTAKFLEEKLEILGLNYKEAEEFIIYWLPKMEDNEYNFIRFATLDEINEYMPLEFSKEPDSLIRVLMQFKRLDEYMEVKEQKLEAPNRTGFVAVEWGGSELK